MLLAALGVAVAVAAVVLLTSGSHDNHKLTAADRAHLRATATAFVLHAGTFGFVTTGVAQSKIYKLRPSSPADFISRAQAIRNASGELAPSSPLLRTTTAEWSSALLYGQGWNSVTATAIDVHAPASWHQAHGDRQLATASVRFVSNQVIRVEGDDDDWDGTFAVSDYRLPVTARLQMQRVAGGGWKLLRVTAITLPNTLAITSGEGQYPSRDATPISRYSVKTAFRQPQGGWTPSEIARSLRQGKATLRHPQSVGAQARASANATPSCRIQKIVFGVCRTRPIHGLRSKWESCGRRSPPRAGFKSATPPSSWCGHGAGRDECHSSTTAAGATTRTATNVSCASRCSNDPTRPRKTC